MSTHALQAIQSALLKSWEGKLFTILSSARNYALGGFARLRSNPTPDELEKTIRDAYVEGYCQAYWDGVADVMSAHQGTPGRVDRLKPEMMH